MSRRRIIMALISGVILLVSVLLWLDNKAIQTCLDKGYSEDQCYWR